MRVNERRYKEEVFQTWSSEIYNPRNAIFLFHLCIMIWRCFTSKVCRYIIIILSLPRHISGIVFTCNLLVFFFINFSLYTQNKGKTFSLPFIFRLLLSLNLSVFFFHFFFPSFCISFTIIFSLFITFVHFPSVAPFL